MYKKIHLLTNPSSFVATSLILILAMLLSAFPMSAAQSPRVFPTAKAAAVETTGSVAVTEEEAPSRLKSASAYKEFAPPSLANSISDRTPLLEQAKMEEEVAELEKKSFSLPEEGQIPYYCTEEEYRMLCWCVEGEARGKSLEHREIIAQVILNRVYYDGFGNSVKEVLASPKQFNAMQYYGPRSFQYVSPLTIEAVDAVLSGSVPDLSQGALYFCNPNTAAGVGWFENRLTRLFDLENHRFYTY